MTPNDRSSAEREAKIRMKVFEETGEELIEKARELKGLRVNLISLVKSPANRKPVVIKSDGSWEFNGRIVSKSNDAKKVYACVYEPDTIDSQNDFATAAEIEKAAHDFIASGRTHMVDYEHNYSPEYGTVVESFILRGQDSNFIGIKKGAWCVVIELSPKGQSVADDIDGVSLMGTAARKSASTEEVFTNPLIRVAGQVQKATGARVRIRQSKH
jgi:hypothetical protein